MSPEVIARRYAGALLEEAAQNDEIDLVSSDMEVIRESLRLSRDLVLFFETPVISRIKKKEIVERLFSDRVQPLSLRFMQLMIKKGRERLFPQVATAFRRLSDERAGIVEAEAQTALSLSEDEKTRLEAVLSTLTGKTARVVLETDPQLLGGLVVRVGDMVYDGSIRNQLNVLKGRLTEGAILNN